MTNVQHREGVKGMATAPITIIKQQAKYTKMVASF